MSNATIDNLDLVIEKLDRVEKLSLEKALNKACILVENTAKLLCPVDTGELRRSITHEVNENEGIVGTNVSYAPYVEFGTGLFSAEGTGRQTPWSYQSADGEWHTTAGMLPQPYLQPALDQSRRQIIQILQDEVNKELTK